ncbi:MAG: hypothetical protein ACTHXC_12330 [Brachybacterium sp.]
MADQDWVAPECAPTRAVILARGLGARMRRADETVQLAADPEPRARGVTH